jgi:hypothetical protein
VAYDLLLPTDVSPTDTVMAALKYGALSGIVGNIIFEVLPKEGKRNSPKDVFLRFFRAALEGATLFATYENSVELIEKNKISMPPELKELITKRWF